MSSLHQTTTTSPVEVTDREAVEELLERHNVQPVHYKFEGREFYLYGHAGFIAYPDGCNQPQTAEFLHAFREYVADGEEWEVQTIGNEKCRYPLVAYQYRVTPEAVYYSDLRIDEHRIGKDGNSIQDVPPQGDEQ